MTPSQGVLFVAMIVMALAWFYCVRSLARQLLQRHPEVHEAMGLSDIWSFSDGGNTHAVVALLRFLATGKHRRLDDPAIAGIGTFMSGLFVAYLAVFGYLGFTILWNQSAVQRTGAVTAAATAPSAEERRQAAYDLHRALQWPQAIAAYDALLRDGGEDAEILFWRGVAQWKSAHFEAALRDFQRVTVLDPANFEAHRSVDLLLARQQRWDEIIAMWDGFIARQPRHADAYFERGGAHFHKGDMAAARDNAAKACALGKAQACAMVQRLKDR